VTARHRVPPSRCPDCDRVQDAAGDVYGHGEAPKPGDVTVCLDCAAVLQFGPRMELVRVTRREYRRLPRDTRDQLDRIRSAILRMN
jgi:hypothetical protein